MQTANRLVRSIFGFSSCNIKRLGCSVEDAYELVAKELKAKKCETVVRQVERLCNKCWERIKKDDYLLKKIVGNRAQELESSSEIIFLLACYMKYEKPFQEVLEQEPALTF